MNVSCRLPPSRPSLHGSLRPRRPQRLPQRQRRRPGSRPRRPLPSPRPRPGRPPGSRSRRRSPRPCSRLPPPPLQAPSRPLPHSRCPAGSADHICVAPSASMATLQGVAPSAGLAMLQGVASLPLAVIAGRIVPVAERRPTHSLLWGPWEVTCSGCAGAPASFPAQGLSSADAQRQLWAAPLALWAGRAVWASHTAQACALAGSHWASSQCQRQQCRHLEGLSFGCIHLMVKPVVQDESLCYMCQGGSMGQC